MSKLAKGSALVVLVMVALVIAGCTAVVGQPEKGGSSTSPASLRGPANGLVQSSSGGGVTIEARWLAEENALAFDIAMDTHSVNLDQYDLGELTLLRDDQGKEYRPMAWRSSPGGHHRSGKLTFSTPDSLSGGQAKYIELVIRNVAGVKERVLKWELS